MHCSGSRIDVKSEIPFLGVEEACICNHDLFDWPKMTAIPGMCTMLPIIRLNWGKVRPQGTRKSTGTHAYIYLRPPSRIASFFLLQILLMFPTCVSSLSQTQTRIGRGLTNYSHLNRQ